MKIQDALKETGKAVRGENNGCAEYQAGHKWYAERRGRRLVWCDAEGIEQVGDIDYLNIIGVGWQPYHEEKEIRPENAGELWKKENLIYSTITNRGTGELEIICCNDGYVWCLDNENIKPVAHNKNGWTRLFPPVEDEKQITVCPNCCVVFCPEDQEDGSKKASHED